MDDIREEPDTPKPDRNIKIYGLLSFYGTERAKKCANYLYGTLPHLYTKPEINEYYDYQWTEAVKKLRDDYGQKYKRLYHLKHPVIIFFNDKYIGDHRSIIHYVIMEHRVLPDLPFPNLFPDFTDLLPKCSYKDYVYFDVRVGNLDDYVIGKMVFELHSDLLPETCSYFKYLCCSSQKRTFGTNRPKWKFSYLGSTIRRICGNSFVQGGKIEGCELRVRDENYAVPHNRRGVISICNEGGGRSTTEFCICLKENHWMDCKVVAFGQLIFGEPILTAIQQVPTYYQRPLKDIIIVGCGVIPSRRELSGYDFETKIDKAQEWINTEAEEFRKARIEGIENFEKKVKYMLEQGEAERSVEFVYTEEVGVVAPRSHDKYFGESGEEEVDEDLLNEYEEEEAVGDEEKTVKVKMQIGDFTLKDFMAKHRAQFDANTTDMMSALIDAIVDMMDFKEEKDVIDPLDYIPRIKIQDVQDLREVSSGQLLEERYKAGMYSIPDSLKKVLVKAFNGLSPCQLKLIGLEAKDLLKKSGVGESTLSLVGSESIISGLMLAVMDVSTLKERLGIQDLFTELEEDTVDVLKVMGSEDVVRNMIGGSGAQVDDEDYGDDDDDEDGGSQ